jgi:hypothetical protein
VLSGRSLCDELVTRQEESYRLCRVVVFDQETSWYEETIVRAGLQSQRTRKAMLHKKDHIIVIYRFSCIRVYKRPDDESQLEPKQVLVYQLIKLVLCMTDLIHMLVMGHNCFKI